MWFEWWTFHKRRSENSIRPDINGHGAGAPDYHGWWHGDQGQVGVFLYGFESLWLPASLLAEGERRRLADALFAASRHKKVGLQFSKGLAGAPDEAIASARATATNPTMIEAFALAVIADGRRPRYPGLPRTALDETAARSDARVVDLAAAELRRVAPHAGSYVSESNYFNSSWPPISDVTLPCDN